LDIVLDYEMLNGSQADGRQVAKALFKTFPRVSVYGGTPAVNESGVAFPEAVLVWNGLGFNWKGAIAAIPEDDEGGRFQRQTDRIPFRSEQLDADTEFEKLIELEAQGVIRWDFTPLEELAQAAAEDDDEKELEEVATRHFSAKTLKLLPFLMDYFRKTRSWPRPMLRIEFEQTYFCYGGSIVKLGRPYIPIDMLDEVATSGILVMPHITARGPNGIMKIERGDKHPLVTASVGVMGYCVICENGEPDIAGRVDSDYRMAHRFYPKEIDIFTTKRKAAARARLYTKDGDGLYDVRELNSSDVLSLLSQLDIVWINDQEHALTMPGSRIVETKTVSSAADILDALRKR